MQVRGLVERRGEVHNRDVVEALGVSAATAHRLLQALVVAGVLERHGKGRGAHYRLPHLRHRFRLAGLDENRIWQQVAGEIARIRTLSPDETRSLHYAATEMLNNAVDHSGGRSVDVRVTFARDETTVTVIHDDGIGVFRRVCEDFGFASPHDAIVQLEQGKLTSDPERHSGEGLFFTSKAVTRFRIESQEVAWIVDNRVGDSAIGPSTLRRGTRVELQIEAGQTPRLVDVFRTFTDPESLEFTQTRSTVRLGQVGTALVSRAEAKRLLARLTAFRHVTLDFSGVEVVGQGFCDEVFRVFARAHPEVLLEPVGMNETVAFMIGRARMT
jgi:anti-sigma regulatory factor (Ser/Thr protein kinase)